MKISDKLGKLLRGAPIDNKYFRKNMKNTILVSTKRSYKEEGKAKVHESWAVKDENIDGLKYIVNDNGREAKSKDRMRQAWEILSYKPSSYNNNEYSFEIKLIEDEALKSKVLRSTFGVQCNSGVVYCSA